jgi:hypothetical protein
VTDEAQVMRVCHSRSAALGQGCQTGSYGAAAVPEKEAHVATVMITHEVDDVEHWLSMPTREEVFGPVGVTLRTFVDPENTNRVGLIAEIPDMDAYREIMASDEAAQAMKKDGVRPETLVVLVES